MGETDPTNEAPSSPFLESLQAWVDATQHRVFAVLDAARGESTLQWIKSNSFDHAILYNGQLGLELEDSGPYLVALRNRRSAISGLVDAGWSDNWGILIDSHLNFEDLRAHLRHFTSATLPNGQRALFAFYDPRVFDSFLEAASPGQLSSWFRAIASVAFPDVDIDNRVFLQVAKSRDSGVSGSSTEQPLRHLVFSQTQLQVFDEGVQVQFSHYLTSTVQRLMPRTTSAISYRDLFGFVWLTMRAAKDAGATTRAAITRFVSMSALIGRPINRLEAVKAHLEQADGQTIDDKLEKLSQVVANLRIR